MLRADQKNNIKKFVEYWVDKINFIADTGLYYSIADEKTGGMDYTYPHLMSYNGKELHISDLDLVAEAYGFTKKDITKSFVHHVDDSTTHYFVYIEYKGVMLLSVMTLNEYNKFLAVLEDNEKEKEE